jgi:hypothetical protein
MAQQLTTLHTLTEVRWGARAATAQPDFLTLFPVSGRRMPRTPAHTLKHCSWSTHRPSPQSCIDRAGPEILQRDLPLKTEFVVQLGLSAAQEALYKQVGAPAPPGVLSGNGDCS